MKTFTKIGFLFCGLLLLQHNANATHNRAGEITFRQIGALTFEVTCTTYTKTSSVAADRDSLLFAWGDGTSQFVVRSNGNGLALQNDIKFNIYVAVHTYPGRASYEISMTDPNRNGGVLNVNPPNSDQVPFHLRTTLKILNSAFQGFNNSPVLLQPPIDVAYQGQVFQHTPNAFDIDGDSIAYELIVPLQAQNTPVTNYAFPHAIQSQLFSFNEVTGEYAWVTPQTCGEYNLAILIKEYRAGELISTIIRDMQILVVCRTNRPPTIQPIDDICVIAGETVQFNVVANDPDAGQLIRLSATGGPFILQDSPAQFPLTNFFAPVLVRPFVWNTTCSHIRRQPYQVVFKAEDNFEDSSGASVLRVVRITVIAPPPQDVTATAATGVVTVNWDSPYPCEDLDRFNGFSVWRREGNNPFVPENCEIGLAGRGYTKIADNQTTTDASGNYVYLDSDVATAKFYCYRILAGFSDLNTAGLPSNFVESIPSDEACVQLSRDLPLLTNVSVTTTNNANGTMEIRWSKPLPDDLDTLQNPPPYGYILRRSEGFVSNNPVVISTQTANSFWQANDTFFVDNGLNTVGTPYTYEISFSSGGIVLGTAQAASSVYLNVFSTDALNVLTWQENVSWENSEYEVYRKTATAPAFSLVATVTTPTYEDPNLINGREYCYFITSIGSYNIPGVVSPLRNNSQQVCGVPIDTVPPCPPLLTVRNDCDTENPLNVDFVNNLAWSNPNETCERTNDVFQYRIYYTPEFGGAFSVIETQIGATDTLFNHGLENTLLGCYYVTAIDSVGNESRPSNIVCKDNCPDYRLPNVFTPNADGVNDLFQPFPYRFVERVEMQIFNRWGGLLYETTDPDINWDGTNSSGENVAEGAYFYTCKVFELVNEPKPVLLEGYIQLIR